MEIRVSEDSSAKELTPIAMAFHELRGLPVTMRSLNKKGVRIERGKVIDDNYTGPVLEQVLQENNIIRIRPINGAYSGVPVAVAPIRDDKGYAIGAIGVVDIVGTIDLGVMFRDYPDIIDQVQDCLRGRVIAP
jgi:hypothetical protein